MMDKKCPYCQSIVEENQEHCKNCNNSLLIECPYCKQTIKVYDEICPKCSSELRKRNYTKPLEITAVVLNTLWLVGNMICITLLCKFPTIFQLPDGDSVEFIARLGQICISSLAIISIPYIIAIVKNYQKPFAISALVINVILAIVFLISIISLYVRYA